MHTKQSDQTHLWTLFRRYAEPAMGFGHRCELAGWLDGQNLPGVAPSAWIVDVGLEPADAGHFQYSHDVGGAHEWTIVVAPATHP